MQDFRPGIAMVFVVALAACGRPLCMLNDGERAKGNKLCRGGNVGSMLLAGRKLLLVEKTSRASLLQCRSKS